MNAWKYEIISRVEQDISLVRYTRNKFHTSAHNYIFYNHFIGKFSLYDYRLINHSIKYELYCVVLYFIVL